MAAPRLHEVRLPSGTVQGIDIEWHGDQRTRRLDVPAGYDGLRIIGAGRDLTHVIVASDQYHDAAIFVGPFNGVVQLENLTVHGGGRAAVHFGTMGQARYPKFKLVGRGVSFVADAPTPTRGRTRWGYRSYQADVDLEDCEFYWDQAVEHCGYADHFASPKGVRWNRVTVHGTGAEGFKVRCPTADGAWTKGALLSVTNCSFKGWYQPHSWRGGAGIVLQGSGANLLVDRTMFWGRAGSAFMRCIMVDNAGGNFYSASDGKPGGKFANGHIVINRSGLVGGPGPDWYGPILRVGPDGSEHLAAQSVTILDCGVYGERAMAQLSHVPAGKIKVADCNTPEIRDFMAGRGASVEHEAMLPTNPLRPFSKGMVA